MRHGVSRGKLRHTKTDKIRKVDMSDDLYHALLALRERRLKEFETTPEWIFCNREGNKIDMHNIKNRHLEKFFEDAGGHSLPSLP